MTEIAVQGASKSAVTIIPNLFITDYMPKANGEFVKVYLYLLRVLSDSPACFTLSDGADALECTERDILRALKYWAKAGLLELTLGPDKKPAGIRLLPLVPQEQREVSVAAQPPEETAVSTAPEAPAASAATTPSAGSAPKAPDPSVSKDTLKKLKNDEDFVQLLFIAEQYLGRTLSPTDSSKIAYFYDQLGLSCELIEYLIEYCVCGGHKSVRYIEAIALAWAEKGIRTVEQAKEESNQYNKTYFAILKALGIKNRNPVKREIALMDTWLSTYGFTVDIIQEACSRTVMQTGQSSFQYADKILSDWKKKGVHSLQDIAPLDAKHSQNKVTVKTAPKAASNRFNNFHQRDYDFDALERQILNR